MANTMPLHEWLRFVDSEYLSSFIRDGGASIKFAVTQNALKPALYEALERQCRASGYVVVKLDAVATGFTCRRTFSSAWRARWIGVCRRAA